MNLINDWVLEYKNETRKAHKIYKGFLVSSVSFAMALYGVAMMYLLNVTIGYWYIWIFNTEPNQAYTNYISMFVVFLSCILDIEVLFLILICPMFVMGHLGT